MWLLITSKGFFRLQSGHWLKVNLQIVFSVCTFTPAGSQRVEHLPFRHHIGHCGTWKWHYHWGRQYTLPVFWHVEDHICLAHGGHGPLQHQLLALWRTQVLVKTELLSWSHAHCKPLTLIWVLYDHHIALKILFYHFCLKAFVMFKKGLLELFGVEKAKFLFHISDYYCIAQDGAPKCLVKKHWLGSFEIFYSFIIEFSHLISVHCDKGDLTLNPCRYCVPPEHGKRFERLAKGKTEVKCLLLIFTIKLFQLSWT